MKQIIQNIRSGLLSVEEVPVPLASRGSLLIANHASLVSAGTEKMVMDLAKKSLLGKARERPDHVQRVLQKIRTEGLVETIDSVRKKLDEPMTMGYSSAGTVLACGEGVQHFKPGDRVASNGPHAEVVSVPQNLCAAVPENVSLQHASFAVLGSIAMQGVRLSQTSLGESVLVIGLGLVGQLTVAILNAAGIRVFGTDLDSSKCKLAQRMGAAVARPNLKAAEIEALTGGLGVDSVLITASTKSNGPIELAAASVRQKGRIVLVGVVGLELDRRPFYFKECEFVVSCSYGPGRYDPNYEQRGLDYPASYVRWTEQRNIQAVLDLMAEEKLDVEPLISHQFDISDAPSAYALIEKGEESFLGVVLNYPDAVTNRKSIGNSIRLKPTGDKANKGRFGVLGAGNFARMVLLPAIAGCEQMHPVTICSAKGVSGTHAARQGSFESSTTDEDEVFKDKTIGTVFSITQHDQHARHVLKAIQHDKNIFVEKPLCLNLEELSDIESALESSSLAPIVMVGFNRRFSPAASHVRDYFADCRTPTTVSVRFNAGDIPADHWTQHDLEGGGRIIGEACHAIDLATYLTGSIPVRVFAESIHDPNPASISDDQCFITLRHANGSISNIGYLAGGDKAFPKERVEVIGGGQIGVINDFREVTTCHGGRIHKNKSKLDKGHRAEIKAMASSVLDPSLGPPIPWKEIAAVTRASILAVRSLREGRPLDV